LATLYAERFSERERTARSRLWKVLWTRWLARYVPPDATVLDVGAGTCDFINVVEAGRRIAVDLNPESARYADAGVEFLNVPIGELPTRVQAETIDVAFASNVFEHLRSSEDLLAALAAIRTLLKPHGRLMVLQPNIAATGARFWDFLDHTLPLTERGMAEALRLSGFEIEIARSRFLPYTTKSRVPLWPWLLELYLALPPAQWLFGKQMFIVARRS
jgi:SAM-dependent methyltransferase